MALTALEWLALPEDEREKRKGELSPHECFLLRTTYEYMPKGPEHYPKGPLKKPDPTPEDWERFWHSEFEAFKEFGTIPKEVTYEEWTKNSHQIMESASTVVALSRKISENKAEVLRLEIT